VTHGIHIEAILDTSEVTDKLAKIAALRRSVILDKLGQLTDMQIKTRLATEKRAPDGTPWKPNYWGTSILVRSGALRDSIHHVVESDTTVRSGSGLVYAAIHHTGGVIKAKNGRALVFYMGGPLAMVKVQSVTIPKRPYLGYSEANKRQVERHLIALVEVTMRDAGT
jgi:phage gpG-like protein